jgi:hypothetical protein
LCPYDLVKAPWRALAITAEPKTILIQVGTNFADKRQSLGLYSSLADYDHGVLQALYPRKQASLYPPL